MTPYTNNEDNIDNTKTTANSGEFVYKIILLDTRSNKDAVPHTIDDAMIGDFMDQEEWNWLEQEMYDDSVDMIILGSSIQILPTDKVLEETWVEFPLAR